MNKLFVHHGLFRIFSPLFSGTIIYLLILLINNNVSQLREEFINQELLVCIGLSYLIQEFARMFLVLFEKWNQPSFIVKLFSQVLISLLASVIIVTTAIYFYFTRVLGYTPNMSELQIFNSIFAAITFIYILLYLSHDFLYKTNEKQLILEKIKREEIHNDFLEFRKGINPELLYESLESIIVIMHTDKEKVDDAIDHLSVVYRYILSKRKEELIPFMEEWQAVEHLAVIFGNLPYRKVKLTLRSEINGFIIPGLLLFLIEEIIRSTIIVSDMELEIIVEADDDNVNIRYEAFEKLNINKELFQLENWNSRYRFYSEDEIVVEHSDGKHKIKIPLLIFQKETNDESIDH